MQKAFSLQQNELNQANALEEERKNILAQIGALTLDMETARAALPVADQKRRQFLASLVQHYGVTDYRGARLENGNLICDLPDAPEPPAIPPSRVNGGLEAVKE